MAVLKEDDKALREEAEKTAREFFHKYEAFRNRGETKDFRSGEAAREAVERLRFSGNLGLPSQETLPTESTKLLLWAAERYFELMLNDLFWYGSFQDHNRCGIKEWKPSEG